MIGKVFLPKVVVVEPPREPVKLPPRVIDTAATGVYWISRAIWAALWPVRKIAGAVGWCGITLVEYIDARPKLASRLGIGVNVLAVLFLAAGVTASIGLIIYALTLAWMEDWVAFLAGIGVVGLVFVVAIAVVAGAGKVGSFLLGGTVLLWNIAVITKRRICPPMTIVRGKRGRYGY